MDYILLDGDQVLFDPTFGAATVVVAPGKLTASGQATVDGKHVCVVGDEAQVRVSGCVYTTPVYSVAGVGMLTIQKLAPNQTAVETSSGEKKVLLKGGQFIAQFQWVTAAQTPAPASTPDAIPLYVGTGQFVTTNTRAKGT